MEEEARDRHQGIWAEGSFMYPADWRKQQKGLQNAGKILFAKDNVKSDLKILNSSPQVSSCPGGALPIKGNIGKKSEKIFHMPGSGSYDRVRKGVITRSHVIMSMDSVRVHACMISG